MKEIEIIKPDDWHVHFRDGKILKLVVPKTTRHFARSIVMPNLIPPILTAKQAIKYKEEIEKAIPRGNHFESLMTVYLTENTNKNELTYAFRNNSVFAVKLYPAGATTNSDSGVKDIKKIMPILETMAKIKMPLLIHGEVTHQNIDIFDREKVFIDENLDFICKQLPELKITLEHITTKEATEYIVDGNNNLAASITPHHMALSRNALFDGGIRPHNFCLPVLKREHHKKALINMAVSGNPKFFLGTDTAPHQKHDKESTCGCAGVFNATYCIPILAEIFDQNDKIEMLEKFVSINGANHYKKPINKDTIKLRKYENPIKFEETLKFGEIEIVNFQPNFPVYWNVDLD